LRWENETTGFRSDAELAAYKKRNRFWLQGRCQPCILLSEETTPWVDLLGKKGQRHDVHVLETELILMSLGSTTTGVCSSFSVFLQRPYPHLKAGADYRVPGDWFFKEVAEIIYPLGVAASRKLADECTRVHVGLDGSPRDGFTCFGLSYRLVLPASCVDDGEDSDVVLNCAASLSLLPNQLHRTEADATVRAVGERNLLKMPAVSVNCAAESVAKLVFEEKAKVVEELKRNEAALVAGLRLPRCRSSSWTRSLL
jgi:hypothetical protein